MLQCGDESGQGIKMSLIDAGGVRACLQAPTMRTDQPARTEPARTPITEVNSQKIFLPAKSTVKPSKTRTASSIDIDDIVSLFHHITRLPSQGMQLLPVIGYGVQSIHQSLFSHIGCP
jgi:hypothetical protein